VRVTASVRQLESREGEGRSLNAPTRVTRSHGAFVVIVGPDGVGKTTISRALVSAHGGPAAYFPFVPPIFEPLSASAPTNAAPHLGKGTAQGSRVVGCLRLVRNALRFWIAYLLRVRPATSAGALVIGDRGMYGYLVQPRALKFYGPSAFARLVLRALPQPRLIVNLAAPPTVVRTRKQELTLEEIERELREWQRLPVGRVVTFDATATPADIAQRIMMELR
jgi:thymidylate kinase